MQKDFLLSFAVVFLSAFAQASSDPELEKKAPLCPLPIPDCCLDTSCGNLCWMLQLDLVDLIMPNSKVSRREQTNETVVVMIYKLPNHPTLHGPDPLSVIDSEYPTVPNWTLITVLLGRLQESPEIVKEILATLHYSLHGREVALDLSQFSYELTRRLCDLALSLPKAFPNALLHQLSPQHRQLRLTDGQVKALVSHQMLGTLDIPKWIEGQWDGPNLGVWLKEERGTLEKEYVDVLAEYLLSKDLEEILFEFTDGSQQGGTRSATGKRLKDCWTVVKLEEADDWPMERLVECGIEVRDEVCILVACNKHVGFGPGGTQEERIFASVPQLLPLPLFAPPLSSTQGILTSPITPLAHFKGHNRTARRYSPPAAMPRARYVFLDALELDLSASSFPDLEVQNIERELTKLRSGFEAFEAGATVLSPPWGCGAFGGFEPLKSLLVAVVAAEMGVKLAWFTTHEEMQELHQIAGGFTVCETLDLLAKARSEGVKKEIFVAWLRNQVADIDVVR
ncbi:hypothetical protein BT69DRAFT_1296073 [Atractiella rhizophila]|nr:hypothetical protein BT69DRAFT_1296073 [Atractiella rhizophila]